MVVTKNIKFRNEYIRDTVKVTIKNKDRGGQAEVVWTCYEERLGVCRKKGDGNEVTGKKEKRKTEEKILRRSEGRYGGSWCKGEGD